MYSLHISLLHSITSLFCEACLNNHRALKLRTTTFSVLLTIMTTSPIQSFYDMVGLFIHSFHLQNLPVFTSKNKLYIADI